MHKKLLLAALVAAACGSAQADPEFKVGGFGTIGMTHSDNHDADYTRGLAGSGPGASRATDFGLDTMGAVQLDAKFDGHWSAVVQLVSERNADNNFEPRVEWANIKYAFSPDFSMRLGRVGLPIFMVSDYRLVGYANSWARGPVEVYNLVPTSSADGMDMTYRMQVGDAAVTFQGVIAESSIKVTTTPGPNSTPSEKIHIKGQSAFSAAYENGPLLLRMGYSQAKVTYLPSAISPLVGGLQTLASFGIPGASGLLADAFSEEGRVSFAGIGAAYDSGKFLVQGEYVQRRADKGIVNDMDAAYVFGGVRMDKFMPYALYSENKNKSPSSSADANLLVGFGTTIGGVNGAGLIALGNGAQSVYSARNASQSTLAFGLRYDFMKNTALKAQFDHIRPDGGTVAGMYPASVNKTNLLTLNLDFVF